MDFLRKTHTVVPFMVAQTIVMFLLVIFPQVVMWPLQWMTR